jgi:DNA-directed RNA polymerase specialized sigma24 family protein
VSEIDVLFTAVRHEQPAFAEWMGRVERPIRRSLARFARAVDIECVVQETLLRMWLLATRGDRALQGENASLRFAIGIARNIAMSEARRIKRVDFVAPAELPEVAVQPEPPADPALRRAIAECLERLAAQPLKALRARLEHQGQMADRRIATLVGMSVNAFLQNIVRARKQMAACLQSKHVPLDEVVS